MDGAGIEICSGRIEMRTDPTEMCSGAIDLRLGRFVGRFR
jgi:hypothetical protein